MDPSLEDLGLRPNLSRLSGEIRDVIRDGSRNGHPGGGSEAAVTVCVEMLRAGYGVDQFWMVMTDPINGIARAFYSQNGEQAEAWLERIVREGYEIVARSEPEDQYSRFDAKHVSNADPSANTT
jgi:hypothetical protein